MEFLKKKINLKLMKLDWKLGREKLRDKPKTLSQTNWTVFDITKKLTGRTNTLFFPYNRVALLF